MPGWVEIVDDPEEMKRREQLLEPERLFDAREPVLLDEALRECAPALLSCIEASLMPTTKVASYEDMDTWLRKRTGEIEAWRNRLIGAGVPREDARFVILDMALIATRIAGRLNEHLLNVDELMSKRPRGAAEPKAPLEKN